VSLRASIICKMYEGIHLFIPLILWTLFFATFYINYNTWRTISN